MKQSDYERRRKEVDTFNRFV